jgi:transcriptional regulator with XRE-family HTH domain
MATILAAAAAHVESREVLRCDHCRLMQFRTANGSCRRCRKPLEVEEPVLPALHLHTAPAVPSQEINVARAVRRLRHEGGMSQRQLAGRMRVPRTYISKIENGKAIPTLSSLQRLADALDTPVAALVQDARSQREQARTEVLEDAFLQEMLPMVAQLNAFQRQVVLSHARDMAREGALGKLHLARA